MDLKLHECDGETCDEPTPAIPPADYEGSQSQWMIELQQRGLWDGRGFHGDIVIKCRDWWAILDACEGEG